MPKRSTRNDIQSRFARNVSNRRRAIGLTQDDLALKAGLAIRHLQKIEAASVNVTLKTISALGDALGIDPGDLLSKQLELDGR